jgi:phosphoribosyl-ATP pyrophosphohydrolase
MAILTVVNRLGARIGYGARMTDSVDRLYNAVIAARGSDPAKSRTARLLRSGRAKMAKKLAEEAVEVVIDAMNGQPEAVVRESADLLYNLIVLWVHSGVHPDQVWAEMRRREIMFGIAEKVPKDLVKELTNASPRRKVVALESRRVRKRR